MNDAVYEATRGSMAELVAHGVTHAIVSPGSRSTPLTIAARWTDGLEVSIHLDERSAGFHALGLARASRRPVVLICTSGTAAANYLPAVIEAHYTGVPLLVFTADRPPELRDWGAGQTIDQVRLFGSHVRHFAELPVAGEVSAVHHRLATVRAVDAAMAPMPGPVHLNWPFREPLEPLAKPQDAPIDTTTVRPLAGSRVTSPDPSDAALINTLASHERGLIVAGPQDIEPATAKAIAELGLQLGWPIVAEPLSQLRRSGGVALSTADHLFKVGWADSHVPDVVLRIGNSPTCKPLRLWLERTGPTHHVLIDPDQRWNDATFIGGPVVRTPLERIAPLIDVDRGPSDWTRTWLAAEARATAAIEAELESGGLLEAAAARIVAAAVPSAGILYTSNSMPVRDLDSFAPLLDDPPMMLGNRGASGIDGVISSAAGAARTGRPTVLLIGDVAAVHDIGGLIDSARRSIDLTIVVPNNDGGGIFSFLPIAALGDEVHFDELFHTPHSTSLSAIPGVRHREVDSPDGLRRALDAAIGAAGVDLIEVPIDRDANLTQHRAVTHRVSQALR